MSIESAEIMNGFVIYIFSWKYVLYSFWNNILLVYFSRNRVCHLSGVWNNQTKNNETKNEEKIWVNDKDRDDKQ